MDSKAALRKRLENLSPEQRSALLQQISRLREQQAQAHDIRPPEARCYPLSQAQRRLWMLSQMGNDASAAYNIASAFVFDKRLNQMHLQSAWRTLLASHDVLRSAFVQDGNDLFQMPHDVATWTMQLHSLRPQQDMESQLRQLASAEAAKPFDLQHDWLVKVIYCETSAGPSGLVVVIHHSVCDGLSISVMIRELAQHYQQAVCAADANVEKNHIASPVRQYRDYVSHEAQADTSKARAYWKDIFAHPPETLDNMLDRPRPVLKDFTGSAEFVTLSPSDTAAFEALCHAHNVTLYMGLVAVVQLLLARFANVDEVTLGMPVAGRPGTEFDKVIGPFVNTIALRQTIDRKQRFSDLLLHVRRRVLEGFQHQGLAFDELVTDLGFAKDPSRSPLYDAMIGLTYADDMVLSFGAHAEEASVGRPLRLPLTFSKVDLTFHFEKDSDGSLRLDLEYATGVLLGVTAQRLCEAWHLLAVSLPKQPTQALGDIALQRVEDERLLLEQVNATARPYPHHSSLVIEFRNAVKRWPDAIAVHAGDIQLPYRTLDDLSDRVAQTLLRHPATNPGCHIAFMLEKDERALIVMLAILKSGAVYLPLAANTPLERVHDVIAAGDVPLLFAESSQMAALQHLNIALIDIKALLDALPAMDPLLPCPETDNTETAPAPAYLMFTSGSTGTPKGTLIEHRAVLRLVCNTDYHQVHTNERVLLTGSLAFDAATFEIWAPLLNGGCVCIPAGITLLDVHDFDKLVDHYQVDTTFLTTGLFNQLVDNSVTAFSRLKTVLTGGEKISVEHVKKLLQVQPVLKLLHVYGPTENTTFSAWHRITTDDLLLSTIPIGRPIANSRIYLLDQNLRPVPIGVPGEIYCGGDGIARGYIGQQALSANKQSAVFLADPFMPASVGKLYRTGDLAKWNHQRELIFIGRNDRQVKVRGFRVELGDVEYHLRTLPEVLDAFVQARGTSGSSELIAWLVMPDVTKTRAVAYNVATVRELLKTRMPNYMLPAKIVTVDRLPLNASGKVDVKALPLPEDSVVDTSLTVESRDRLHTKAEHDLARLYATVLGLSENAALAINRESNFFSLGGDSIRAIQLVSLARSTGYQFALKDIFASETLAGLAMSATVTSVAVTQTALRSGPLSPTQRWWLEQCGTPADHFNLSSVFRVSDPIDMDALRAALDELLVLHPVLRLTLELSNQQQHISDKGNYVLREVAAGQSRQQCWQALQQAIDLQSGILLAVGVANQDDAGYLAIVVHHLAADEVSGRLFAENLTRLYQGYMARRNGEVAGKSSHGSGAAVKLPLREELGYINWAAQIKSAVERGAMDHDLQYWQAVVARGQQILNQQQDLFSDSQASRDEVIQTLPHGETEALLQLGSCLLRMTPQELLLASFVRAWQHVTQHKDCLLSLEGHGRETFDGLGDCSSTMGWFTSLYPFVAAGGVEQQIDLYRSVKDNIRRVPTKGFSYLPLRFFAAQQLRESLVLKPGISFNYLGETVADQRTWLTTANEHAGNDHGELVVEPFKLDVLARIHDGQVELRLRGQQPQKTLSLAELMTAWTNELGTLQTRLQEFIEHKTANQSLLSLSDCLVDFASLTELDNTLAALQVQAASVEEILPLTGMQAGMWLHVSTQSAAYQDQVALRLHQPLDETSFARAVATLVAETQALRTGFAQTVQGELLQIVFRERSGNYQFIDQSQQNSMSDEQRESELRQLRASLRSKPRDLLRDPLFHLTLVRLTPDCVELIIDFHHMALDGWTSTLLLQRLETLYFCEVGEGGNCRQGKPASGMRRYFEWLSQQSPVKARDYWQQLLGDYQSRSDLPAHRPRMPAADPDPVFVEIRTGAVVYSQLTRWCEQHGLTVNATVQALWGVFLGRQTGSDDLVFGATVSGRDIDLDGVSNIAGMLINTLPVRIRAGNADTFAELVRQTARQFAESMSVGHLTLAEIQTLSPARADLVTHALVFENYPGADDSAARWSWQPQEIFDPMHFEFGLIVAPLGNDLSFRFVADGNLYVQDRLEHMGRDLCALLAALLDAQQSLDVLAHGGQTGWSLSANFTADSLAAMLQYHEYISGNSAAVTLLPYDQSVQELINPGSRLRRLRPQQHVVLWRPATDEDGRVVESAAAEHLAELVAALSSFASTCPKTRLYVVPCPWHDPDLQDCHWILYREFTAYIKGALATLHNAQVLSLEHLSSSYALQQSCYPPELVFGDIPYTGEFFAALANSLARARDLQVRPPVKVYVVDADDTLWGGIVGEDGVHGVRLDATHIQLQRQLLNARAAGALICLATKNNEDDVRAVFEQREMPLRWSHLTRVCAGWRPKSESVFDLAEELSLGVDSFVFIDDSPLECEQVLAACPGVRAIQLPPAKDREAFLNHLWLLDARAATREDAARARMYAEEQQRSSIRKAAGSYTEFLDSLEIHVDLQPLQTADIPRVAQLSQRTNQFNTTGIRYSDAEIAGLLQQADIDIRCISVTDKYGDYGLTGSVFIRRGSDAWTLTGFMLSCRVLGRGVEHRILRQLAQDAALSGARELRVEFVKLARNAPALQFLQSIASSGADARQTDDNAQFRLPVIDATQWYPVANDSASNHDDAGQQQQDASVTLHNHNDKIFEQDPTRVAINGTHTCSARRSRYYEFLASKLDSGDGILDALRHHGVIQHHGLASRHTTSRTVPASSVELTLAAWFSELLGQSEIFCEDTFHELGGHSLKAMMLFSRIAARYGLTLDFRDLQRYPTLAALAACIDDAIADPAAVLSDVPMLTAVADAESYPLSPGQSRLWMVEQLREDGPSPFHMHATLSVQGVINRPALDSALKVLFEQHEALRTCFREDAAGAIRQIVLPVSALDTQVNWLGGALDDAQVITTAQEQNALVFDLRFAPLVRFAAGSTMSGHTVFFITMHHIISDGWSIGIFSRELSSLYKKFSAGSQVDDCISVHNSDRLQFRDFAVWQIAWLASSAGVRAVQFWREHFAEPVEPLQLPSAAPRPALMQSAGASLDINIDASIWLAFKQSVSHHGLSDFSGLFAVLQLVLARLSGQQNFCIGTAVAGRQHQQLETVIGFFVNMLPLRSRVQMDSRVDDFLRAVAAEVRACLSHQGVPFDSIVTSLDLQRDPGRTPLFDVLLVLQNTDIDDLVFDTQTALVLPIPSATSQYDLSISAFPATDGSLTLRAEYNSVLYSPANIERVLRCMVRSMTGLTESGSKPLFDVPWLDERDITQVRACEEAAMVSDTAMGEAVLLPEIFRHVAKNARGSISDISHNWSYVELEHDMQRIAGLLLSNMRLGGAAKKQSHVGVIGKRSARSVAAMLGVMDAGAVYVPLDLSNPLERLLMVIEEGAVDLLLSTDAQGAELANQLVQQQPQTGLQHIAYSALANPAILAEHQDNPGNRELAIDDIAYMIFTSGSTGKPKGVQISHAAFAAMIRQQIPAFEVRPDDICGQFAALSFDASLSEIFLALFAGASLVIAPEEARSDIDSFMSWLNNNAVTVMTLPPVFLRALDQRPLGSLRVLVTAGEAAIAADLRHYASTMRVINAYGPTETSVCATTYQVDLLDEWPFGVPIGKPLPGVLLSVRDAWGARVPIGATGELYIGGATLAKGYFSAPALDAQKFSWFADDPDQVRYYRSGDLVRWRDDGLLEFLGRSDTQIKVRGYRIEPGEIEHAARSIEGVKDAIALVHAQSGLRLVCLTHSALASDNSTLRNNILTGLGKKLPRHMIPGEVLLLTEFPLSTAGKIDRAALLAITLSRDIEFVAPQTRAERVLATIWQHVLKIERVGRHDDFFALGGDSIKALEVINRLRRQGLSCVLKDFFSSPSLMQMADVLVNWQGADAQQDSLVGDIKLLPVQNWFLGSRDRGLASHFHIVAELDISPEITEVVIKAALAALIQHHDSLRARFYTQDGQWVQEIQQALSMDTVLHCYQRSSAAAAQAEQSAIEELACSPFELEAGPLLRAVLVQTCEGISQSLVLTLHHLVADWVSLRILIADLNALTKALISADADISSLAPPHMLIDVIDERRAEVDFARLSVTEAYFDAVSTSKTFAPNCGAHKDMHTLHLQIDRAGLSALRESLRRLSAQQDSEFRLQDVLLATALSELRDLLPVDTIPLLVESHGRDGGLDLARQVAWLTRARLYTLDTKKFCGADALRQAHFVLTSDINLQPDVFACLAADPVLRGTLPALMSFNYLGEFANSQHADDQFRLTSRVFEKAIAPASPVDVPLHMEFYVVDYRLEIQIAWSPQVFASDTMHACWENVRRKLACF